MAGRRPKLWKVGWHEILPVWSHKPAGENPRLQGGILAKVLVNVDVGEEAVHGWVWFTRKNPNIYGAGEGTKSEWV